MWTRPVLWIAVFYRVPIPLNIYLSGVLADHDWFSPCSLAGSRFTSVLPLTGCDERTAKICVRHSIGRRRHRYLGGTHGPTRTGEGQSVHATDDSESGSQANGLGYGANNQTKEDL